jgi:hypothetical protein
MSSNRQNAGVIGDGVSVISGQVARRPRPIHYGASYGEPLSFTLIFGALKTLDRADVAAISAWLSGRKQFAPLVICQRDLEETRFYAIITRLQFIEVGGYAVAFEASVVCDSPYAYAHPETLRFSCGGSAVITLDNTGNVDDDYFPQLDITLSAGSDFKWENAEADNVFALEFKGANTALLKIHADGSNLILRVDNSAPIRNLYQYMTLGGSEHYVFPVLRRGLNDVKITGNCILDVTTEYPMNIGY